MLVEVRIFVKGLVALLHHFDKILVDFFFQLPACPEKRAFIPFTGCSAPHEWVLVYKVNKCEQSLIQPTSIHTQLG